MIFQYLYLNIFQKFWERTDISTQAQSGQKACEWTLTFRIGLQFGSGEFWDTACKKWFHLVRFGELKMQGSEEKITQ